MLTVAKTKITEGIMAHSMSSNHKLLNAHEVHELQYGAHGLPLKGNPASTLLDVYA